MNLQLADISARRVQRVNLNNAVDHVGPQPDGSWVLGPSLFFSSQGILEDPEESKYAWIGHLDEGPGIAHPSTACSIQLPLSIGPLQDLYAWAKVNMQHNYIPSMLPCWCLLYGPALQENP